MTPTTSRFARRALTLLSLFAVLGLPGCVLFQREQPLTPEEAYRKGMEAYQAERWGRAATLLNTWVEASPGDPRLPDGLMALGTARMHIGDHLLASADFLRIVTGYPTSPLQQPARFELCRAYRRLSPRPELDQEHTQAAIAYCESYAQYYGTTPQADTAREWVGDLTEKLAQKLYQTGFWYFRRGLFDAAVIYFQDAVAQFPQTAAAPAALAKMAEAYDRIGYKEEAQEARDRLKREYPQSEQARALAAT